MAIDSILSSLEAGIAEGRKDALARQQLEQQRQQAAQSQANNDRTYQLSVLNSMIGLQQSMPKPVNPLVAQAQTLVEQFGGPGNLAKVFRGEVPAPEGFDVDNAGFIVNGAAKVDDSFAFLGQAYDPTPTGQARRDLNRQAVLFGVPKEDLIRLSATGDIEGLKKINPNITDSEGSSLLHMATIGHGTEGQLYSKAAELRALGSPEAVGFRKEVQALSAELAGRGQGDDYQDLQEKLNLAREKFLGKFPELSYSDKLPGNLETAVKEFQDTIDNRHRDQLDFERNQSRTLALNLEIANAKSWYYYGSSKYREMAESRFNVSREDFRDGLDNARRHSSEDATKIAGMLQDLGEISPDEAVAVRETLMRPGSDRPSLAAQLPRLAELRDTAVAEKTGVDNEVARKVPGFDPMSNLSSARGDFESGNTQRSDGALRKALVGMRDTRGVRESGNTDLAKSALREYADIRERVIDGDGPLSKTSPVWRAEALYAAEAKLNAMKEKPKTQAELMNVLGEATMSARSTFSGRIADDLNIMDFLVNEYSGEIEDLPDKE